MSRCRKHLVRSGLWYDERMNDDAAMTVGSAPIIVVVAVAVGLALIVIDLPRASCRRHHHVTS